MECPLWLNIQRLRCGQMGQMRQLNAGMVKGQDQVCKKALRFAIGFIQ